MEEDEYVGAGGESFWHAYNIWCSPRERPETPYKVVVFYQGQGCIDSVIKTPEGVGGHTWDISIQYTAWFTTLEEARAAADAFVLWLHWKYEAEWLGKCFAEIMIEELSEETNREVSKLIQVLQALIASRARSNGK